MLTNSIILFLRDLLPVFIMLAYSQVLFVSLPKQRKFTLQLVATILLFSVAIYGLYENISELADGSGLEIFQVVTLVLGYLLLIVCIVLSRSNVLTQMTSSLLTTGAALICSTHVSSLFLFLNIYFSNQQNIAELVVGCAMGLGISLSFYFLLVFVMQELVNTKFKHTLMLLFAVFLAGQISVTVDLLQQIDVLNIGVVTLFDISTWISESSEYGYLLKALFGFDTSPTLAYTCILGFIFALTFILLLRASRTFSSEAHDE